MDYPSAGSGTTGNDSLVYAQWEAIHNPAIIGKVFQSDEDGSAIAEDLFNVQLNLRLFRFSYLNNVEYRFFSNTGYYAYNIKIGNNVYTNIAITNISSTEDKNILNYQPDKMSRNNTQTNWGIGISEKTKIWVATEAERDKLFDFIVGIENDIYGTPEKEIVLNGKTINLNYIIQKVEERYVDLLTSGNFYSLTIPERKVLDIPIIQWKNNAPYGAAFMNHWFEGSGEVVGLTETNNSELLFSSSVFNSHFSAYKNEIWMNQDLTLLETQYNFTNLCNEIINSGKTNIYVSLPSEYETILEDPPALNYLAVHNITELHNLDDLKADFANAIGSVGIGLYYEGELQIDATKGEAIVYNANLYWRINDRFNFIDGKLGEYFSQPLGTWSGTVFEPQSPVAGFEIRNSHFVSLYKKLNDNVAPSELSDRAPNYLVISKLLPVFDYPCKITINTNDKTFKIDK